MLNTVSVSPSDYDFQSSLMEALCRMATTDQRKELAYKWFRMSLVASAFAKIRDSEFETVTLVCFGLFYICF